MRDFVRRAYQQRRNGQVALLLSAILGAIVHGVLGNFSPRIVADTAGYLRIETWERVFGEQRTPFYGWLVNFMEAFAPGYIFLPWLQYLVLLLAMLLLYRGALRYGLSVPAALALTLPLPFGNATLLFLSYVHPEMLAISMLLIALACALYVSRGQSHWSWYLIGGLALGFSYLLKPGFLLFIVLLPVLVVFLGLHANADDRLVVLQRALIVCLIGLLPFMVYSGVRYAAVGHFHVVSFGGYAGTGLSSQIMDAKTIPRLPTEFQESARAILEERRRKEIEEIILPLPINSTNGERIYWSAVLGYFDIFARNYDHMVSIVFRELREEGMSWVEADNHAQAFNGAVKRAEPINYVLYVVGATTRFMGLLLTTNATFVPAFILLILMVIWRSIYGWSGFDVCSFGNDLIRNGMPLFLIVFIYVVASYVPAVAITFPARRYVDTAGILMASLPLYLTWLLWCSRKH